MTEFILNNSLINTSAKSGMTLLQFLREEQQLKGTKSGCKEGDCGACTVLIGTLEDNEQTLYKSVTSCLTPIANIHGKHVVSIEGLNLDNKLNVPQQSLKDNYATQCGFCTPGFVVSLSEYALDCKSSTPEDGIIAISGNICRCTGYKSIERAIDDISAALLQKNKNHSLEWLIEHDFLPAYFKTISHRLKSIAPTNQVVKKYLVSGGTDVYVTQADALSEQNIQTTFNIPNEIIFLNGKCIISANTSLSDIVNHELLHIRIPKLDSFFKLISSRQIRNMATLAGNFVNASPIGDMSILFLALNSDITLINNDDRRRTLALNDFFIDYKKTDLKEEETIQNISFKMPNENTYVNFEKVSKRTHLDIASVNSAISIQLDDNKIKEIHMSVGGVSAIPKYLHNTNQYLLGKEMSIDNILQARDIMLNEISPISDVRGTISYKNLLSQQLFYAHFIQLFPHLFTLKDLLT